MKIGFIGGGNMAQAILTGLQALKNLQTFNMADITVIELDTQRQAALKLAFGVQASAQIADVASCDAIVLAVKPQQLKAVAEALKPFIKQQLIISIAAGIRIKDLSLWLGQYSNIIRAMPNTPAQVQAGITGLYAMPNVSSIHITFADNLLRSVGETVWLDQEIKLDAVTAISGSGPAYVFYFIEALQQAAVALGLDEAQARQLSISTFKGAAILASTSTTPVNQLREQVTSKGGTTEQGLHSLAESQTAAAIVKAAHQAYLRAQAMGDEFGNLS